MNRAVMAATFVAFLAVIVILAFSLRNWRETDIIVKEVVGSGVIVFASLVGLFYKHRRKRF
jgi:uncharacterized membrane protein